MLLIDLEQGRLIEDDEAQGQRRQHQALQAVDREPASSLHQASLPTDVQQPTSALPRRCSSASKPSVSRRKTSSWLAPMAKNGEEGIGSWNDSPLAVLSDKEQAAEHASARCSRR